MWTIHPKRHVLPLIGLLFAASSQSIAQSLPLDPVVRMGKLTNGFTYYIRHNTEPKNRVVFYLANKIGAIQEDDNQRGLAHFMEHMSFNGTKHFPKNQLVDYLQKAGVRFGADLNAYTGFTETVYQLPLPSDDTSIVRNGLQIMRDWAAEATLETDELNKERGVVLEEKRLRNGAQQRMQEVTFPLQVNNSRYASRLPIGTEAVLKNFTPATIKKFYTDWYRPNLQALIVVGDVDVNSMEQQIKKLFGDLKNPAKERERLTYTIPLTGKNQFKALTDAEQTSTQISVLIKQPGTELKTKADYRNEIIRNLYNFALAGRFRELAAKPNPPFIQAEAGAQGFMGGLDAYGVSIGPKPGKIAESFTAVWTEVVRMQQFGVLSSELERAKIAYLTRMENAYKESSKTPSQSYVQEYLQYFLKGTAAPGMETEYQLAKELTGSITLAEVNALAGKAVKDTDRDIFINAPEKDKASLPDEATVNSWIAAIRQEKLTAWQDTTTNEGLLKAKPAPGKVVKREKVDELGVTILTLSNGVKIWIKPTDFKNEEILFSSFSEGGTSLYPDSLFLNAANAAAVTGANGLSSFTPVELGKMLTGKSAQAQPYVQDRYEGINGAATPKDLETALQLTYLYFTAPRKDSLIFSNIISRSKAGIANRSNSPEAVFGDTVSLVLGKYHYRRQPITAAKMDSISLEKAFTIYKERFSNAGDFTFVFTGSIDTATFIPLVEQYLGSLPSTGAKESAKDLNINMPEGQISKTIYKGKDNKAVVRLLYSGAYTFSETNNIQLSALGAVLQYRMLDRIRELEGGAYTPQAGVSYGKLPQARYVFSVQFTCAPANADKLIAAANEEIEKIKKGGVSADDISKFTAEQTRTHETQLQSNAFWRGYLMYALQNNEPATNIFHFGEQLKTVTPQTVQQAAQQYISSNNYIKLVLMPEAQK
jgi:zinc protease